MLLLNQSLNLFVEIVIKEKSMTNFSKIVVHKGQAHADDFLASCVAYAKWQVPVERRDFTDQDLNDNTVIVLDQGREYEPEKGNFDHHQTNDEVCAFTQVMDYLYGKDYRKFMPELKFVEIFDSQGPQKAAKFAKTTEETLEIVNSVVARFVLRAFSQIEGIVPTEYLTVMKDIGKSLIESVEDSKKGWEILENNAKLEQHDDIVVLKTDDCEFVKEGFHLPTKLWCKKKGYQPNVIFGKNTRGGGYCLLSINTESLKFLNSPSASFTHATGFLTVFPNKEEYLNILKNYTVKG